MNKYLPDYKWSNIFAMVHNLKGVPKICSDSYNHKLVVITGATSGIGYATAKKYASCGADLLLVNRNEQKSITICDELRNQYKVNTDYILVDFTRLSDIHTAAKKLLKIERKIDILIHNAGVYNTNRNLTVDGIEEVFQTNYLSTFILNYCLKEKFLNQAAGRIIFVNSEAYRFAVAGLDFDNLSWAKNRYSGILSYGNAKLAQLLSMLKFNKYFSGCGVTINAMHPGNVKTNSGQNNGIIYRVFKKLILDSNAQKADFAAEALYYLGVSEELASSSGKFFNLTTEEEPAPPALDMEAAEKLWAISLELGGIYEAK